MQIERVKLQDLKPVEKNVRKHPEKQLAELRRSFKMFGQTRPFVVDEENTVLVGNGLLFALQNAEKPVDEVSVLRMQGLSEKDKRKLMIADNKTFELGMGDMDNLLFNLEMFKDGQEFDIPGYEEDFLQNLLGSEEELDEIISDYGKIDSEDAEKIMSQGKSRMLHGRKNLQGN